ncbi:MAG: hypothetical protein LUG14_03500 [Synergistaceae bacterium]|nr:hypothetical protein [Synergistaceae bacterium]
MLQILEIIVERRAVVTRDLRNSPYRKRLYALGGHQLPRRFDEIGHDSSLFYAQRLNIQPRALLFLRQQQDSFSYYSHDYKLITHKSQSGRLPKPA